jgi:VanZ family protein
MIRLLRILAWLLAAAVIIATLGPARYRPLNYNLGQDGEHALAFLLIGLAFGFAYNRNRWLTATIAVVLAGVIEILQIWAPGRHARLEDFLVDAFAALIGLAVAPILGWVFKRARASSRRA